MKIAAVIAEYNPFHNGHKYQLEQIKTTYGYDYVIIIMSGDFTQRGIPAIWDKYERTRMALFCGADLVLELPTCYATGSAEFFASGAVSILNGLGCVNALFFGSESGNIALLQKAAALLAYESPEFKTVLNASLQKGTSFAKARLDALEATGNFSAEEIKTLSLPNDILGLEYCKALLLQHSPIEPIVIKRIGTGYHDLESSGSIASAEAIRQLSFTKGLTAVSGLVPSEVYSTFENTTPDAMLGMEDFSALLHYQLLMQERHLEDFQDCTEDIANRIRANLSSFTGVTDFLQRLKTKELAYTRLNRVLTHILLSIKKEDILAYTQNEYAGYARILGFCKRAQGTLLSTVKQNAQLPLIAKPADFSPSGALDNMFCTDILASHIYQSVRMKKSGINLTPELKYSPIIL